MDFDRYDALLHHIFKHTQGDAWFKPHEDNLTSGVALRINDDPVEFRVFPYENISLEPFETAVRKLNPVVAVKVRSASVHAALSQVSPEHDSIYVDANTRIQVLDSMLALPFADKEQCAAFIRDERVLVVWSSSIEAVIPTCQDFEDRLIKLLWRSRPAATNSVISGSSLPRAPSRNSNLPPPPSTYPPGSVAAASETERENAQRLAQGLPVAKTVTKRTWYGKKYTETVFESDDQLTPKPRKAALYAPVYNGLAAALALLFLGNGVRTLLREFLIGGDPIRFVLAATLPFLYCVSLFFTLQIVQNVTMAIGPIAHYHKNSKYYSAIAPKPSPLTAHIENKLPHLTIQMPVYKESLETVLAPSIASLKRAMQTYARQDRDERISFYRTQGIGWVARPRQGCPGGTDPHDLEKGGAGTDKKNGSKIPTFHRPGRFKKASNMNYGLALSLLAEKHLENLVASRKAQQGQPGTGNNSSRRTTKFTIGGESRTGSTTALGSTYGFGSGHGRYGTQYMNKDGDDMAVGGIAPDADLSLSPPIPAFLNGHSPSTSSGGETPDSRPGTPSLGPLGLEALMETEDLEEEALQMAIEEMYEDSDRRFKPWAANGKALRVGEIMLLVDSDTVVPEDCFRDAVREMAEDPEVAIIQHESDVMQVAHHYFENGIAYFTRRINRCISMACANGEVAPFVGHNAFLRWRALQDAVFKDPADDKEKVWSESNVSEDFDLALRLIGKGYVIRWATYSNGGFKEGVSLTVDDELNRWQKYAYGCNELLFNPFVEWFKRGPIAHQIRRFIWSNAPIHYKISMMAYMFSYYGIAASMTIAIINYVLLGFEFSVDGFYLHSFEIWLATTVVFFGSGNVGYTLLEYRLGKKELLLVFSVTFDYPHRWNDLVQYQSCTVRMESGWVGLGRYLSAFRGLRMPYTFPYHPQPLADGFLVLIQSPWTFFFAYLAWDLKRSYLCSHDTSLSLCELTLTISSLCLSSLVPLISVYPYPRLVTVWLKTSSYTIP
ncbi:hypothetical protein D9758_000695 [Tetrapyrgos nigripes]|uniref:Glycosyltransferase 2-like domain-containing protein n=1 Tax=Tetrapyrgos nigripes TaxID=182062 RepID=A0A8H5LXX8_9AGAR|nr:hypothetical protein D9758_000695 [Tetrapyrgos nigripes]